MARTIPADIPVIRKRTKIYVHDHYRIDLQFTDGIGVPALLVWLFYKGEPVKIRLTMKDIMAHIDKHWELRKQFDFEHPRFEAKGDLADWVFKDDPFLFKAIPV